MEKTRFVPALATVSLAALLIILNVSPSSAIGRAERRANDWSQVGGNRFLQLGNEVRDSSQIPNILLPTAKSTMPDGLQPEGTVVDAPVDFNGDGKTDFVVVRNTGGGPSGQLTWYYAQNGGPATGSINWGLNSDWILSEDFDGDLKDDVTIWRPGTGGAAAFYIFLSGSNTVRIDQFGQTGDIPSIIADYDGDGKADPAVFRVGSPAVWYYRPSLNNPGGNFAAVSWGLSGDILAPGDWDGDGRNDFGVARNSGNGQLDFWRLLSNGTVLPVIQFGTPSDFYVPGDYDGDRKTDIATVRSVSGHLQWQYVSSISGGVTTVSWGAGNDYPAQGDYDGDGKTDFAIWRRGVNPGESAFWIRQSLTGGVVVAQWGLPNDFPVAAANVF